MPNEPSGILHERRPTLWIRGDQAPDPRCDRLFLVVPDSGQVFPLQDFTAPATRSCQSLRECSTRFFHHPSCSDDPLPVTNPRCRLVVVRAVPVRHLALPWKTPAPLACAGLWEPPDTSELELSDPRAGSALQWLASNPAPGTEALASEVAAWLQELIPRIGEVKLSREEQQALVAAIGSLVAGHPQQVLETFRTLNPRSSNARQVLYFAIKQHLTRETLRRHQELVRDDLVLQLAGELGWQEELVAAAAARARLGWGWQVKEILLGAPREAGMSTAEWQALFRLYPSAKAFRVLCAVVLPRDLLEHETDRLLVDYQPRAPAPYIDPLLELALARGHQAAPGWLHEALAKGRGANPVWVRAPLREAFDSTASLASDAELVKWFMAQDPASFEFDHKQGKYRLRQPN
jgi:hypothetical protein